MNDNSEIYEKQYSYSEIKAICEVFKYREEIARVCCNDFLDYEDIIQIALQYYAEWEQLANLLNGTRNEPVLNEVGNEIEFISEEEFEYEQVYIERRIKEDYLY